jgi:glycyl-tRNA synthetase
VRKQLEEGKVVFKIGEKDFEVSATMLKIEKQEVKIFEEKFTPSVIEPSFGIGRIIYCIFEHCFKVRAHDDQWTYFDFPP